MEELSQTIERLIARYEQTKDENLMLRSQLSVVQEDLDSCRSRIEILEKKINDLELAQALMDPERKSAAERRIGRMIQDIDYCIELLEE